MSLVEILWSNDNQQVFPASLSVFLFARSRATFLLYPQKRFLGIEKQIFICELEQNISIEEMV